jgi:ComF family protein
MWSGRWLPARCEVCGRWPAAPVCAGCQALFSDAQVMRCTRCAAALTAGPAPVCNDCRRLPSPFEACANAVAYAFPWDGLMARFKFGGEPGWAGPLAELMRARPAIAALLARADAVVPMPLAPRRLAERGYNQAWELARRLAPRRQLQSAWLRRVRDTAPQSSLPRGQRPENLAGAFAVDACHAPTIRGRHLLLVDDVMTSGATLREAALALRRAGAARVSAVVLARTDLV